MSLEGIEQRLLGTFLEENTEGLARFESGLLALEKGTHDPELIGDIFRAIHSLKGSASSFGFAALAALAHEMETHLDRVRSGQMQATPELIGVLLGGVDLLRRLLDAAGGNGTIDPAEVSAACERVRTLKLAGQTHWRIELTPGPELFTRGLDPARLFRELNELGQVELTADVSALPSLELLSPLDCHLRWTIDVRGSVERKALESLFEWLDGGWTLTEVKASQAAAAPTKCAEPGVEARATDTSQSSVRVTVGKLDQLMNMVGELVITQAILGELDESQPLTPELVTRLREGLSQLASNTRALQESVMRLRSMPLSTVFARLPRMVHDLAAQLGKKAELVVTGESTELDKTVLERLGDPLVHLVRNCLDHGLEKPAARVAKGKNETGTLTISARNRGSDIFVEVGDDGGGLDLEKIYQRAQQRGLLPTEGQRPSDEQLINLIFQPGFSTAEAVTDVSGRGVGMDVVQRNVRALGGDITVSSTPGQGTRFVLRLPLTLAIIDGQLVRVGSRTFVVPLLSIVESVQPERKLVHQLGERAVYRLREELVPMVDLAPVLGVQGAGPLADKLIVVIETESQHVGLLVDELLGQQQVVVKSLERNYGAVQGIAGATILGDGNVSFILEMSSLVARLRNSTPQAAA